MSPEIKELLNAIDHRIAAAQAEIASLEVARSVLVGVDALAGKAPERRQSDRGKPVARPRRRAARRGPSTVDAAELKRLLADAGDGLGGAALAKAANAPARTAAALLRELERAGEVRSSGERRTRRWTLVTDEDRIARRVAELERARAASAS